MARAAITAAFALALAVRLLVPTGFMPAAAPGGIVIEICGNINGAASMVVDLWPDRADHAAPDHQQPEAPCAFAALSMPALVADPALALSAPEQLLHELALPPPIRWTIIGAAFLLPPLRGPPALA